MHAQHLSLAKVLLLLLYQLVDR